MDVKKILADIDRVLAHVPTASDHAGGVRQERAMVYVACIERWAPPKSPYVRQARETTSGSWHLFEGILLALRADIENGSLRTFEELIHADVFEDVLAHAAELNRQGYMLPAAVVAGAALEEHLRQLARIHGVSTADTRGSPRQASALNTDLYAQATAYSKAESAQVDAWQKCRNMAAHGDTTFAQTYDSAHIQRVIDGIRAFISKYPA